MRSLLMLPSKSMLTDTRIRQKLEFARTDILRLANAAMRMSQFAGSGTLIASSHGGRVQIREPALMLAIRCWERQMSLIIAHTKWDIVNGPRLLPLNRARFPPRQPEPPRLSIDLAVDMCPLSGTVAKGVARWVRAKDEVLASKDCNISINHEPRQEQPRQWNTV